MKSRFQGQAFYEGDTYNESTKSFIGVDLTTPAMQVNLKRGIASNNYIQKQSGKVETRAGYEQIAYYAKDGHYVVCQLLGAWDFVGEDGASHRVLACVKIDTDAVYDYYLKVASYVDGGSLDLSLDDTSANAIDYYDTDLSGDTEGSVINEITTSNNPNPPLTAYGVASNGRLYVLMGERYVCVRHVSGLGLVAERVGYAVDITHTPITKYAGVAKNASNIPTVTNVTLEYPNLLSPYRKEMFVMGLGVTAVENEVTFPTLSLGTACGDIEGMTIQIYAQDKAESSLYLGEPLNLQVATLGCDLTGTVADEPTLTAIKSYLTEGAYILVDNQTHATRFETMTEFPSAELPAMYVEQDSIAKAASNPRGYSAAFTGYEIMFVSGTLRSVYGDIYGVVIPSDDGKTTEIVLFHDYEPGIKGQSNVTVTYTPFDDYVNNSDYAEQIAQIEKCQFGTLFGANNSLNRLWVSGNPDMPNYAFHSDEPYKGFDDSPSKQEGDFTYFTDVGMLKFGEQENSIIAMSVISVNKMAILKNHHGKDRTMFYVEPTMMEESFTFADNSTATIEREVYATSFSNTATAGYSHETATEYNGDFLFLSSEKQIVGLDIEGITGDSQRVAYSRSHFIDGVLKDADVEDSWLFTHGNTLYFATKDKTYATMLSTYGLETTGQYEWWPLDAIPGTIRAVCHLKDETWVSVYSDNWAKVYKFREVTDDDPQTCDIERLYTGGNNPSAVGADGLISVDSEFYDNVSAFPDNSVTTLSNTDGYEDYEPYISSVDGTIYFEAESQSVLNKFGSGFNKILYSYTASGTTTYRSTCVKIDPLHDGTGYFRLVMRDGTNLGSTTASIGILSFQECEDIVPNTRFYQTDTGKFIIGFNATCFFGIGINSSYLYVAAIKRKDLNFPISGDGKVGMHIYSGSSFGATALEFVVMPREQIVATSAIVEDEANGEEYVFFANSDNSANYEETIDVTSGLFSPPITVTSTSPSAYAPGAVDLTDGYYAFQSTETNKVALYYKNDEDVYIPAPVFALASDVNPEGYLETRTDIVPSFVTLRFTQAKLGYDKTIANVTIWNDSSNPSELMVGVVANENLALAKSRKVIDPGMSFNFDAITFEHTGFSKNVVPALYNLKRFPKNQQTLALAFSASGKRNSVLSGVDILYHIRKARNKR